MSCDGEFPGGPVVRRLGTFTKVALVRLNPWSVHSVVFDSLWPHGLWHNRLPCPFTTSWSLFKLTSIKSVMPSNHLILCYPLLLLPPASGSFPRRPLFTSGGQIIGVSASASVLPMNIQDWFPLGSTGWISLQTKGLTRVFSNATV